MLELGQPLHAFERERVHDTIVFFGSARMRADGPLGRYYAEARELARSQPTEYAMAYLQAEVARRDRMLEEAQKTLLGLQREVDRREALYVEVHDRLQGEVNWRDRLLTDVRAEQERERSWLGRLRVKLRRIGK